MTSLPARRSRAARARERLRHGLQAIVKVLETTGYVAKGLVYVLVGSLALGAACGLGGDPTDPTGALAATSRAPGGRFLLVLVGLGLLAHAAFRAILMVRGEPRAKPGRLRRVGRGIKNAVSGLVYLGLAITAEALALGGGAFVHVNHDVQARHWSARVMAHPLGRPLLLAVAVGILIAAAVQIIRGVSPIDSPQYLRTEQMSRPMALIVSALGRFAYFGRAAVLTSGGWFLARAAVLRTPSAARGPAGALHGVWEQPHGGLLLGLVAAGLVAFGLYALLEAYWRRLVES